MFLWSPLKLLNRFLGDSGGGFYTVKDRKWTILGIVSVGVSIECLNNPYVLYTNVINVLSFVNGKIIENILRQKFFINFIILEILEKQKNEESSGIFLNFTLKFTVLKYFNKTLHFRWNAMQ
jgi:hypothetical protein